MLTPENRLISGKDFDAVYQTGHFFSCGNISIKVRKNGLKNSRIGFSVGIKFSPKAVTRNKFRRWLREIVKEELGGLENGLDMVIMLKKDAIVSNYKELKQDFKNILKKGNWLTK